MFKNELKLKKTICRYTLFYQRTCQLCTYRITVDGGIIFFTMQHTTADDGGTKHNDKWNAAEYKIISDDDNIECVLSNKYFSEVAC